MADPLSLAASVAGLISLGLQVTGGITKYLDAVKCRDEELSAARQQNTLLKDTLTTIEKTAGKLNHVPPEVIAVTKRNFKSFNDSLTALEGFVAQLASSDVSTWRSRLKDKAVKLHYAFDRSKLKQLCERVRQTHCSLQLAIDGLKLSITAATHDTTAEVQHRIPEIQLGIGSVHKHLDGHFQATIGRALTDTRMLSEKLDHAGEMSQSSFNIQHGYLERIQGQNSDLVGKLAGIEQTLQALLITTHSVNEHVDENVSVAKTITRLIEKPAVLRECCDMIPSQNTMLSKSKLWNPCICGCRRKIYRKRFQFGPWCLYSDLDTEGHLPNCPMSRTVSPKVKRQYGINYTGLVLGIEAAVGLSFLMSSGAGGWSLGPNFTYHPTVDERRNPAFQIISLVFHVHDNYEFSEGPFSAFQRKALAKVARLFSCGKTSPLAVNDRNQSLMHLAFSRFLHLEGTALMPEIVQTLILHGVPPISYDIWGGAPGFYAIRPIGNHPLIPISAQLESLALIAEAEGGIMPMTLNSRLSELSYRSSYHKNLARSPSLAEACGCGPLSMAILAKDAQLAQSLLERYPTSIMELDSFGHTPLHLAASLNLLPCLPSLLRAAEAADIIRRIDSNGRTALYTALMVTGEYCCTANCSSECSHCTCCDSLMMLLEAGAIVCEFDLFQISICFPPISLRGWRHFIGQLKVQRENLKAIALRNTWAVEEYLGILQSDQVLDLHAFSVYKSLRAHGINVLKGFYSKNYSNHYQGRSIFSHIPPHNLAMCKLAFQLGFRDVDFDSRYGVPPLCLSDNFGHIDWLLQQGADLKRRIRPPGDGQSRPTGLTSAHYLLYNIASYNPDLLPASRRQPPDHPLCTKLQITTRALSIGLADACWCPCSMEGCTPFVYLLKGYHKKRKDNFMANVCSAKILDGFPAETMRSFYLAAMRFSCFVTLGLTHTCCDAHEKRCHFEDQDEVDEIHQEESKLIEVLDGIVAEFENKISHISGELTQSQFHACWDKYWAIRVPEILQELEDNRMTEAERQGAELIGVVWESDDSTEEEVVTTGNPYDFKDIDHWYYELDSIAGDI